MKNFPKVFYNSFKRYWPLLLIVFLVATFFYPVWLYGKIPLPADFVVGTYFPWLDYKWGYEVGVPVKNYLVSDVASVIYPLRIYAIDQIKSGQFPFWNSAMLGGYPLLANFQVAIFSPTILFYFLFSNTTAWTIQIVSQPLISMVGMFLLLRHFGLKKLPSVLGGVIFAFAGFSMIWLEWNVHSLVAGLIPFVLLFYDKFLQTGKFRFGFLTSVFVCLQAFAGYPQVSLYTVFAVSLWGVFRLREVRFKKLLLSYFFLICGIILASPFLIPGFELLFNSQRQSETLDDNLRYLPWKNLITLLAPDFYGNPSTINFWGEGNYGLNTLYSGVIALILSVYGFWVSKKETVGKYFLIIFVLSLLLALPSPLVNLIYQKNVAGLSALSPTRMFVLINFSVAVLAAFGFDFLSKAKKGYKYLLIPPFLIGALFAGIYLFSKFYHSSTITPENWSIGIRNLVLPALLVTFFAFVLVINKFEKLRKITSILVFLIVVFEMFRYGWKFTPFTSPRLAFPETPIFTYLKNQKGPFRVSAQETVPMNMWIPYSLESMSGYDAVYPVWWAQLNSTIRNKEAHISPVGRYAELEAYLSPWYDFLNIKYVIALKRKEGIADKDGDVYYLLQDPKFKKVFEDRSVAILENTKANPRAIMFGDWETMSDIKVLEKLADEKFSLTSKVLLNEDFNGFEKSSSLNATVDYLSYSPNKYQIEVNSDKPGFLFVSDVYYPGWEAFVDGKGEKIYKADYSFKAVPVSSGKHLVTFVYKPKSFYLGVWISLGVVALLLSLSASWRFVEKKISK